MFLARPILTTIASKAAPWLISKAVGAVKGLVDKYVTHKDVNSVVNKVVDVYGQKLKNHKIFDFNQNKKQEKNQQLKKTINQLRMPYNKQYQNYGYQPSQNQINRFNFEKPKYKPKPQYRNNYNEMRKNKSQILRNKSTFQQNPSNYQSMFQSYYKNKPVVSIQPSYSQRPTQNYNDYEQKRKNYDYDDNTSMQVMRNNDYDNLSRPVMRNNDYYDNDYGTPYRNRNYVNDQIYNNPQKRINDYNYTRY